LARPKGKRGTDLNTMMEATTHNGRILVVTKRSQ
jgi:hypothetical protein